MNEKQSAVKIACRHYWVIESASGPTSKGVCKICGEEKEFQNSWVASSYMGKDARVLELPNMLESEEEEKEEEGKS
jgi:hypothetical protein